MWIFPPYPSYLLRFYLASKYFQFVKQTSFNKQHILLTYVYHSDSYKLHTVLLQIITWILLTSTFVKIHNWLWIVGRLIDGAVCILCTACQPGPFILIENTIFQHCWLWIQYVLYYSHLTMLLCWENLFTASKTIYFQLYCVIY